MDLLAIGTIRTAWGVKGWLKLASFSGEWEHFAALETVDLKAPGRSSSREYRIEEFRMHQGIGMFKLAGVDTPEAGKLLAGWEILVPRSLAAPLKGGEWYLGDLVGLEMVDESGSSLGKISGIIESADDLLEVETPEGQRFYIPFRSEFVGEPDLEKGTLALTAPWLLEDL